MSHLLYVKMIDFKKTELINNSKMGNIVESHRKFLNKVISSSKFNGTYNLTALPTVLFYLGASVLTYEFCHKRTRSYTRWKLWSMRELTFQWIMFYAVRIWFYLIKCTKYALNSIEGYFTDEDSHINSNTSMIINYAVLGLLSVISSAPVVILICKQLSRDNIQNFFVWLGEDPWLRSEIGLSGHYLDRPPNVLEPPTRDTAYRIRRSCSLNDLKRTADQTKPLRSCRSASRFKCVGNGNNNRITRYTNN